MTTRQFTITTKDTSTDMRTITLNAPAAPPRWALLTRLYMDAQADAVEEFFAKYFDERGYLMCVPRWGGDDGPDDAAENLLNFTALYTIGGRQSVLDCYRRGWDGHLAQYTEAKTVDVPFARGGMYYKEFPTMFDWMHNGEGWSAFTLEPLADPYDDKLLTRSRRYAGFYMGDEPGCDNWDPENRLIRSMINGSRGPMMRQATGLDWAGDPIEVEGRFRLGHGERNYEEMVAHFKDYNDVIGDHPLNMHTTSLALNVYALSGEDRYRDWALDYLDAWLERIEANNGILPTNVGLDGTPGGAYGGRWWGGVYGWGFTVEVPQTGEMQDRPFFKMRAAPGLANGLLLSGDQKYVEAWRTTLDGVNAGAKEENGQTLYPTMHGDDGWYSFVPEPYAVSARELYYWSMRADDRLRVTDDPWLDYLDGSDAGYPENALESSLEGLRAQMEGMRTDHSSPDTRLSDDMNRYCPSDTDPLLMLGLGAIPSGRDGFPLHARVRYFDPKGQRPGYPDAVAGLVTKLAADSTDLTLCNLDPVNSREVIVQAGAYGEHRFTSVASDALDDDVKLDAADGGAIRVVLAPSAVASLTLGTDRYVQLPTALPPWDRR